MQALTTCAIMSFQYVSTTPNFLPSSGIWALMSSELKIGSKYNHVAWHFNQLSRISWIKHSLASQACNEKKKKKIPTVNNFERERNYI